MLVYPTLYPPPWSGVPPESSNPPFFNLTPLNKGKCGKTRAPQGLAGSKTTHGRHQRGGGGGGDSLLVSPASPVGFGRFWSRNPHTPKINLTQLKKTECVCVCAQAPTKHDWAWGPVGSKTTHGRHQHGGGGGEIPYCLPYLFHRPRNDRPGQRSFVYILSLAAVL